MRQLMGALVLGVVITMGFGCASDQAPPPPHAQVSAGSVYAIAGPKPLPAPDAEEMIPPPPFYDPPLIGQQLPEESAFVNAYNAVGRPRIVVFVNRTLEGQLLPVNPGGPAVTIDRRINYVSANGPTGYRGATDIYLHPGQYDEAAAKSVDYQAMEAVLTDWMSADGRVEIVSPSVARQRLSDQQVKDLQTGRPIVGREIADQLDAPVLIQVQAHPTRQTLAGLQVRMVAEAIDLKHGGVSLARAVVDVPPPLDKIQINVRTRFLVRKLMDGMIGSWEAVVMRPMAPQTQPATVGQSDAPVWPVKPQTTVNVPTPPALATGQDTQQTPVAPVNSVPALPLSPEAPKPHSSGPTTAPSASPGAGVLENSTNNARTIQ